MSMLPPDVKSGDVIEIELNDDFLQCVLSSSPADYRNWWSHGIQSE